jgi:hypothetical protein
LIGFAARRFWRTLPSKRFSHSLRVLLFEWNSKMRDRMLKEFSEARLRRAQRPILVGLPESHLPPSITVSDFSASDRKIETKNIHQYLPTRQFRQTGDNLSLPSKNVKNTSKKTKKQPQTTKKRAFALDFFITVCAAAVPGCARARNFSITPCSSEAESTTVVQAVGLLRR